MKKLLLALLLLVCSSTAYGQSDAFSALSLSSASALKGGVLGEIGFYPVATDTAETNSTKETIVATSHVARVGDVIIFTAGTAGNIRAWSQVGSVATNSITVKWLFPATPANADAFTILRPVPIDASLVGGSVTAGIAKQVAIDSGFQRSATTGILKLEDVAHATGDAGIVQLAVRQDVLASLSSATNDYDVLKTDPDGKLYVNMANTSPDKYLQACSAANTGTSDTPIVAAVASNRIYVTSYVCYNTSAVASILTFKDGASAKWSDYMNVSTSAAARMNHVFPQPIRGTVNTAFNFAMTTTATSTICCVSYYTSAN